MLTISKPISAGQAQSYHKEEFANARDNYYSERETIEGRWGGKLAESWGLVGEVNEEHFARLSEGQHPLSGEQLVRHQTPREYVNERGETIKAMEHRAGWDATFSAPKSVSLTALVGGDARIRAAHRESVDIALNELEQYVQARLGGNRPAETTGRWIVAKFEHDSSRPVDGYAAPQLHTHAVFFNLTRTQDGEFRALQPQELYRTQQYATAVYRSELALRLKALGYEIEQGRSGQAEIKGYSPEYIEASSPRSEQIKRHLAAAGVSGAGAAQIAAHQTRESKLNISHEEMREKHRELAARFENQPGRVMNRAEIHKTAAAATTPEKSEQLIGSAITYSRERNIEREAVAEERALLRDALKRSMGEASLDEVRAQFESRIQSGELIEREARIGRTFTTPQMINYELENMRMMCAGQNRCEAIVSFETRREIEKEHQQLSTSQRAAVEQVLSSRDQLTALEGTAGAGKTTSLMAIRGAAEREQYRVEGFAPTSRAAQKLEEAGINCTTLQHHLAQSAETHREGKHLYIVDESSLASTKQMNDFLRRLEPDDRVLLVGDVRQHQAVEAGRPYEQLQEAGIETARLDEIVRQRDPELKQAVEQLARGEVREAIVNLDRQGRVCEIENREERLQAISRDYADRPQNTLVVSPDNESRREINALVHHEMQQRGAVGRQQYRVQVLEARQELTGADRAWSGQYERGDILRYSRGSQQLGIEQGEYARVESVNRERNQITVQREDGQKLTYDPRRLQGVTVYKETERSFSEGDRVQFTAPHREMKVANRELGTIECVNPNGDVALRMDSGRQLQFNIKAHPHLDYGYAVTSHSSQGQTADRVLIHIETGRGQQLNNSRTAYVAVSRGRHDARIYTNDKERLPHELARQVSHRSAVELVLQQEHSGQRASVQMQVAQQERSQSLGQTHER